MISAVSQPISQLPFSDDGGDFDAAIVESPHGGGVDGRRELRERFRDRLRVNPALTRRLVSYQGNRSLPGFRWLKYKEGFSRALVERLVDYAGPQSVLDPFAGIGTVPLIAAGRGLRATGIEIMPVGVLTGQAIASAGNGLNAGAFDLASKGMLDWIVSRRDALDEYAFPHVPITPGRHSPRRRKRT